MVDTFVTDPFPETLICASAIFREETVFVALISSGLITPEIATYSLPLLKETFLEPFISKLPFGNTLTTVTETVPSRLKLELVVAVLVMFSAEVAVLRLASLTPPGKNSLASIELGPKIASGKSKV